MVNGNSARLAFGKEATYNSPATPSVQVQFTSADFKPVYNKTEDGLLTGAIGKGRVETMGITAEGSLSTVAKPVTLGFFLKAALGLESETEESDTEGFYVHEFKCIGNAENDYLPSLTAVFDRIVKCNKYTGLTVNTLALSSSAGDYVKMDVDFIGREESNASFISGLSPEAGNSFKFHQGKVIVDTEDIEATSLSINFNNNLEQMQTTHTGLYSSRPKQGTREITGESTLIYSTQSEAVRTQFWNTDATFTLQYEFSSADGSKLTIEIPNAQITAGDPPAVQGAETLQQQISFSATVGEGDYVVVTLENTHADAY